MFAAGKKQKERLNLAIAFALAAGFFALSSFFGVYTRDIYHAGYFLLFFVLEILFFLGLSSGNLVIGQKIRNRGNRQFYLTKNGALIIGTLNVVCILSFVYFLYLFIRSVGLSAFGSYTAVKFQEEGRTSLEQLTLLLMQFGGDAAFLVVSCDTTPRYRKLKRLSSVCLFLPGLRYLLMGSRFMIAVEALMFVIIKRQEILKSVRNRLSTKRKKRWLIILLLVLFVLFMYLFATRAIYYTALEKFEFQVGDIQMRPFWKWLYNVTSGRIDFFCSFSDYMGESPYVFSYYCRYGMPESPFWGVTGLRPVFKIIEPIFGVQGLYDELTQEAMSGKYSGCFYSIICDFGIFLAPVATYLYGLIFAKIERARKRNRVACTLFPAVLIMCVFAPVYFFNVGRLDFTVFFAIPLALLCLAKTKHEVR